MKKLLNMLKKLGADVYYDVYVEKKELTIDFNNFEGFNEEREELDREYNNPELVQEVLDYLETNATFIEKELYTYYQLEGWNIQVGYTSFDI